MDSILAPPDFSSQSSAPRRLSTSSVGPLKLRDSCDACAASKVKCHKEKPVCSRCAKRKIPCKYVATKRAGRKHENRQNSASSGVTSFNTQVTDGNTLAESNWPITPSTASASDYFTSANTIEASLGLHASSSTSEAFSSFLSPVTPSVFTTLPDLETDLDRFFASNLPLLVSEPGTENTDPELLGESCFFSGQDTPNSISAPRSVRIEDTINIIEDGVCELPPFFSHSSPSSDGRLSGIDKSSSQGLITTKHSCSCLLRALEHLRKLFPTPPESCRIVKKDAFHGRNKDPTVQAVIVENQSVLSALNDMLDCPCSEDGYVLAIISLVTFKVMGWYAAAAGKSPANKEDGEVSVIDRSSRSSSVHQEQVVRRPEVVGKYHLAGNDSDRMAAQLVLSELHRVQRLVNRLSENLRGEVTREGLETPSSLSSGQIPRALRSPALPFSSSMLDHLGIDLRRRLRTLSLEIVESLRSDS